MRHCALCGDTDVIESVSSFCYNYYKRYSFPVFTHNSVFHLDIAELCERCFERRFDPYFFKMEKPIDFNELLYAEFINHWLFKFAARVKRGESINRCAAKSNLGLGRRCINYTLSDDDICYLHKKHIDTELVNWVRIDNPVLIELNYKLSEATT